MERSSVPTAVLEGDEHVVVFANAPLCALFGVTAAELTGQRLCDRAADREGLSEWLDGVARAQTFASTRTRFVPSLSFSLVASPLFDGERPDGLLIHVVDHAVVANPDDLTKVNEALLLSAFREQQLAADAVRTALEMSDNDRLRTEYVALISHDLMGPLASSRLAAEMVAQVGDDPRRQLFVDRLHSNLRRMEGMLSDMLDANAVRSGKPLPLRIERCDLVQIARGVAVDLGQENAQRITVLGDASVEGTWSGRHISRALWNLLSNALKHGEQEKPITVRVIRSADTAKISVHNQGPLISEREQQALFAPYSRTAAAAQSPGWGLGLTLVRACAEAHGGTVELVSTAESGTTFTVTLPVR